MDLLPCVECGPEEASTSIVWLHGLGADGHDFEPIVPELRLADTRFILPHAPRRSVTVNGGMLMPAWFDIAEVDLRRTPDEAGLRQSADQVEALLEREHERGARRLYLAGFSQGGAVALHLGLRYGRELAGIVALSTYMPTLALPDRERLEAEHSAVNRSVPVFQAHGQLDPVVDLQRGEETRDHLGSLGYSVDWHEYPMMHEVCLEEIVDLRGWLQASPG